ncbi:MAG: exonuclease domain-containing protein [Sphingobacteriaceae bacterium]
MRDYLLFLDTEATGLPRKWNLPYTDTANWPSAVQIAWLIYKKDGTLLKTENHYIGNNDKEIDASSTKIHGITREYLDTHGESRNAIMKLLADDMVQYNPLVVGHFMEFDFHIVSADFYRTSLPNPIESLPTFCTMLSTSFYVRDPSVNFLRLGELYTTLFNTKLENQHNALVDAQATAECYFELCKRGDITDEKIELQQLQIKNKKEIKTFPWIFSLVIIVLFGFLIDLWI